MRNLYVLDFIRELFISYMLISERFRVLWQQKKT